MVDVVNPLSSSVASLRSASAAQGGAPDVITEVVASGAPETPQAPYVSPYISINFDYDKAVLQIRDSDTGNVQEQFPTESRLAEIRRAQAQLDRARQVEQASLSDVPQSTQSSERIGAGGAASSEVITVQDVASSAPANTSGFSPQIAVAALSSAAQSATPSRTSNVSVQA